MSSISPGATTVVAPESVGSMTTKGQMKPTSWQGEFNGVPGPRPCCCHFLNTVSLCIMHATVWKELTAAWETTFGEPLSNESLGNPPPQGRTRFLTMSGIGASRLAASSAQEARAGRSKIGKESPSGLGNEACRTTCCWRGNQIIIK